ncbi:MAG: hypothetical protein JWN76_3424, partial [Chitinophagaceae bacterium]|nr:hypothetical protein [Chitinophagaceae bacterium]
SGVTENNTRSGSQANEALKSQEQYKNEESILRAKINSGNNETDGSADRKETSGDKTFFSETMKEKKSIAQKPGVSSGKSHSINTIPDSSSNNLITKPAIDAKSDLIKINEGAAPAENRNAISLPGDDKTFIQGELRRIDDVASQPERKKDTLWKDEPVATKQIQEKPLELTEKNKKQGSKKINKTKGSTSMKNKRSKK